MGFISTGHGYKVQKGLSVARRRRKAVPKLCNPSSFIPSPSPSPLSVDDGDDQQGPTLDSLPTEIILLIYRYVGVGTVNNMSLINRHLHLVIPLVIHDGWWLLQLVDWHFVVDLNENVSPKWQKKFSRLYDKLPDYVRESWDGSLFLQWPKVVLEDRLCLDGKLFEYWFMMAHMVKAIAKKYPICVLDRLEIEEELALRDKFLQWKYLEFSKVVQIYGDNSANEAHLDINAVIDKAVDSEEAVKFRDDNGLASFLVRTESTFIREKSYVTSVPWRIMTCLELMVQYHMEVESFGSFVLQVLNNIDHFLVDWAAETLCKFAVRMPQDYGDKDVISLLQALKKSQEYLFSFPLEDRSECDYAPIFNYIQMFTQDALAKYYMVEHSDDEMVWDYLRLLEMPELVQFVLSHGGIPR